MIGNPAVRLLARSLFVLGIGAAAAASGEAATCVVTPGSAWCGVVNAAAPGDTILFSAGSYPQTCTITASGTAVAPITLRLTGGPDVKRFLREELGLKR